ncbi:MAG: ParA family protein [Rhodoluna sp.]|nr:ParA family protein [Rhodoluna sp.]
MSEINDTPLAQELSQSFQKLASIDAAVLTKPANTRIFTVSNQKGGVGKTTTTVNIAAALASKGMRVLVLDLDPQGNASTALNIPHHAEIRSLYEVLMGEAELEDVIQISSELPGLYCVPATIHLTGVEMEMASAVAREQRLKTAIERYLETTMSPPDYIFIDCPPSLGLLTINAWTAAREILVPIQCEYYALEGVDQLMKYIELVRQQLNPKLELSTVLLTMYDGRTRLAEDVVNFVREKFPTLTLNSVIPRAVRVSEAPSFNRTVITHDRRSPGSVAYLEAAIEIATRGAQLGR